MTANPSPATQRRRDIHNQAGAPTGSANSHRVLAKTRRGTLGLLGGLLVAVLAAGCSTDTGTTSALSPPPATPPATATPIPAPTPTPTTTEESARGPERPDLSQVDAATGEALALYYLQSYVEAHVTRDATVINEFAHPDCRWCASVITGVQEYVDEGWYASGGELTFSDIVTTEISDTFFNTEVTLSQAEMLVHDTSGAVLNSSPPSTSRVAVGVLYDGDAWRIVGVDTNVNE